MTDQNIDQVQKWFDEYGDFTLMDKYSFENLKNKPNPIMQVAAIMFLASKVKPENKDERFFLEGGHKMIYIGSSFAIFEDFTEEDVKTAVSLNIDFGDEGFEMYASM